MDRGIKPRRVDHMTRVSLASFGVSPSHYILTHINLGWAVSSYHWWFMAQPCDLPEKLISGHEDLSASFRDGAGV